MEMTHSRRKKDAGKIRKRVLRKMKATDRAHRPEHAPQAPRPAPSRKVPPPTPPPPGGTLPEAANIVARIDDRLALLPEAVRQAHERMNGGRPVDSRDKILSAHNGRSR